MSARTQLGRRPPLPRNFYARSSLVVARELLGMVLVYRTGRTARRGRIVETEAYGGSRDRASHAYRGRTARNAVMFGQPGAAYVYFTYGMHWLLNVVCQDEGIPAAVLIRGIEIIHGPQALGQRPWGMVTTADSPRPIRGPARLTKRFRITGALNGEDLVTSRRLWIERPKGFRRPTRVTRTPRIGVDYAGRAAAWKRRFVLMS